MAETCTASSKSVGLLCFRRTGNPVHISVLIVKNWYVLYNFIIKYPFLPLNSTQFVELYVLS